MVSQLSRLWLSHTPRPANLERLARRKVRYKMLTAEEIAAINSLAQALVKAIKLDNTVINECEDVFGRYYAPTFRWPSEGPTYISWEAYSSPVNFELVYYDGPDVKGSMKNADEAQRTKQKHNMEAIAAIATLLNQLMA